MRFAYFKLPAPSRHSPEIWQTISIMQKLFREGERTELKFRNALLIGVFGLLRSLNKKSDRPELLRIIIELTNIDTLSNILCTKKATNFKDNSSVKHMQCRWPDMKKLQLVFHRFL